MINLFINIGYVFLLINLILFIKGFSIRGKAFRVFTSYLLFVFVIQITSGVFFNFAINNLFLSHFYFVGQFVFLSFFYLTIIKNSFQKRVIERGLVFGLCLLGIQYGYNPSVFFRFNLFEIFVTSFLLIIFATFHLYNLLGKNKEFYYVNLGILIYLSGSTVLFLVGNLMTSLSPKLNKIPWILNAVLYIVYQIFILVEWKKSFSKKEINTTL
ncbi:hypothetical protein IWX83_002662 [Flavobacterium sp. CG_9.1]|nr:hypothetical protein [Flavobacterium sp. CG_9.1]